MEHVSKYTAKIPDENGEIYFTDEEHLVWHDLMERQMPIVEQRACEEFLTGLELLKLSEDKIPSCAELNTALGKHTGWSVKPVPALIPVEEFFTLLANRIFPAASFIRLREEFDYLQEPDLFHEYFGHCPLLTNPHYADFMQAYGKLALASSDENRALLGRLYWFTVEFGLINRPDNSGVSCYGGGILSSIEETVYSVDSDTPERRPLGNGLDALRTPYRIDILQPIYYVIDDFSQLYELLKDDGKHINKIMETSKTLGEFAPTFPPVKDQIAVRC